MNILLATSEAVPFAKTGGLADVCGALPIELERLGHQTAVIMPAYRRTEMSGLPIEPLGIEFIVPVGSKTVTGHLFSSRLPGSNVPVYLVRQDDYFDRDGLYQENGKDYVDNCERFVFFSRAVMEAIRLLELNVDVIHCNDWQTGLIPAYLKFEYRNLPRYQRITTLHTIHNLAYQGAFWHWDMLLTGLNWKHFNFHEMEFFGKVNLLKTGLVFCDAINTVSPSYAKEIQTPEFGCGLEALLMHRRDVLSGVLNGIDPQVWNPATDPFLAANYDADSVRQNKPICKVALQEELGLPQLDNAPLVGIIGRLAHQKGLDMVAEIVPEWTRTSNLQWAILGTGDLEYEDLFDEFNDRYPDKFAARLEFSNELAHKIEAGADMFLMPSRYEPCGLNQMYSLAYGTVPIVRETGGLADTIADVNHQTLANGTANGFTFLEDNPQALSETLRRASEAYRDGELWQQLVSNGMRQDWSWARSAQEYASLYERMAARTG